MTPEAPGSLLASGGCGVDVHAGGAGVGAYDAEVGCAAPLPFAVVCLEDWYSFDEGAVKGNGVAKAAGID